MRIPIHAAAILLFLVSSAPASGKYYEASHYNVVLRLDAAGDLAVTETVDFRFVAGPFQFVFREIPPTETDGIRGVAAWMDGQPCAAGTGPGQAEISGVSPVLIRWHFAPIMAGVHSFTVKYQVAGTIRLDSGGQSLIWRALPRQRGYPIGSADIVLEYPANLEPATVALNDSGPRFNLSPGRAEAVLVHPDWNADVVVRARFPAGSFSGPPPQWPIILERKARNFRRGIFAGAVGAMILLVLAVWWMFRLRESVEPRGGFTGSAAIVMTPPSPLPAAQAGLLTGRSGLSLGTLFDLANRDILRIEEVQPGITRARRFRVVWKDPSARLTPHEVALLQLAFRPGETTVKLQDFFTRGRSKGKFVAAVRNELRAAGLIDPARASARWRLLAAGCLADAAGTVALVAGLILGRWPDLAYESGALIVVGAALLAAGILSLALGVSQPVWSDAGRLAAARWKAFAHYLKQAARGRTELPGAAELEQFLPYAAVFGLAGPLLERQKNRSGIELPGWFQAIHTAPDSDAISFMAFVDASSSGGSFDGGSGGGGGGGASGGGSSGAG